MGWFIKKSEVSPDQPLYTTSQQRTVLVVGLGNIGDHYDQTRHNIGFATVDAFASSEGLPAWVDKRDLKCHFTKGTVAGTNVILIKPTTYMNESGQAVLAVQKYFKLSNKNTLVVHDELDVAFGQIRTRIGGGSAGNNGIKSLIACIGADFARIRIGIKNELLDKMESADFVLAKFSKDEQSQLPLLKREVMGIISEYLVTKELPHDTRNFVN